MRTDNTVDPTVLVRFKPDSAYQHRPTAWYPSHWSDCRTVISNLALACQRIETRESALHVAESVRQAGLGALVTEQFESAELVMSDEMYRQLIGVIK